MTVQQHAQLSALAAARICRRAAEPRPGPARHRRAFVTAEEASMDAFLSVSPRSRRSCRRCTSWRLPGPDALTHHVDSPALLRRRGLRPPNRCVRGDVRRLAARTRDVSPPDESSGGHVSSLRNRPGQRNPRGWTVIKRVLDKRLALLLADRGEGRDHTTAAANIASLIETVAAKPGRRILNIADSDAPTVREIAHATAARLGHSWHELLLDGTEDESLGRTPWDAVHPICA